MALYTTGVNHRHRAASAGTVPYPTARARRALAMAIGGGIALASALAMAEGGNAVTADPSTSRGEWPEVVRLAIPPAARDVAPDVTLVASHHVVDSVVGGGWQLQVGSVIRRRSAAGGVPTTVSDLTLSSFLVDGVRLVSVTGPGAAHYQRESYDADRFDYVASSDSWTRKRDGWTWVYGSTANTTRKLTDVGMPIPACTAPCNTEAWFLKSAEDPFGNRIDYTYEVLGMPTDMVGQYGGFTSSNDYLVKTITYAASVATVEFVYADRKDITVDVGGGLPVVHRRRLSQVLTTVSGTAYSTYVMQYEDDTNSHPILGTITDCDNVAKPVATDPYAPAVPSLLEKIVRLTVGAGPVGQRVVRCNRYNHEAGLHDSGVELGARETLTDVVSSMLTTLDLSTDAWTPIAVDFDGDARVDLFLVSMSSGSASADVYISTPNRTTPFVNWTAGGDAGLAAGSWSVELNRNHGFANAFPGRFGRSLVDLDGDALPEVLVEVDDFQRGLVVEARTPAPAYDATGAFTGYAFTDLTTALDSCDLRYGTFADVDGDHRQDLIVRAHGAGDRCGEEPESFWLRNAGAGPWLDSALRQSLTSPVERGIATDWPAALAACTPGEVAPPTDVNDSWTVAGYLADQARYDDFNGDGIVDVAYALYACWEPTTTSTGDRWRAVLGSAYSRIFLGNGTGGFLATGLSAGPPVLLDTLDWDTTGNVLETRITGGTLGVLDVDRDGHGELLQSTAWTEPTAGFVGDTGFGIGFSRLRTMDPVVENSPFDPTMENAGFGVRATALVDEDHELVDMASRAWDCDLQMITPVFGDFDGDGFVDVIEVSGADGGTPTASLRRNLRAAAEGRLVQSDNEHGGRTTLGWGFSASLPNTNPELPVNVEVLQSVSGPGGTRTLAYHGAVWEGDRTSPFATVTVTNDRGGVEAYSFVTAPWANGAQHLGVRYREDGSVEHVTVLVHGQALANGLVGIDLGQPYFDPLIRRCEYDVGFTPVDLDLLTTDCLAVEWMPDGGGPSPGEPPGPSDVVVTGDNYQQLLGRDRAQGTAQRRATFAAIWRSRLGRIGAPRAGATAPSLQGELGAALAGTAPPIVDDYYRWPIPATLAAALPDVETAEAAYTYPAPITSLYTYVSDWQYTTATRRLDRMYEHRDLATLDDDRYVDYEWSQPFADGYWYQLTFETTRHRNGMRLTRLERSDFARFDVPRLVSHCGRQSPQDCQGDAYTYTTYGALSTHTLPASGRTAAVTESWTRTRWCGEPTTYTDPIGRVTTTPRDGKCLVTSASAEGATRTFTYDGYFRVKKLATDPGAGKTASAKIVTTYYYDDALTYNADVGAREDSRYAEPRYAIRRSDGRLSLAYLDGLGRTTRAVTCHDANNNTTGGDISLVACTGASIRNDAWNLYGADGSIKVSAAPFKSLETPTTVGTGHDSQARPIVVLSPVNLPGSPAWQTDTILYGAGYAERTSPTGTGVVVTRREHTTLGEETFVDGISRGAAAFGLLGQVTSITAPDGAITALSYDDRFLLLSEKRVNADGSSAFEDCVLPDGTTAQLELVHTITDRDARGRILEEMLPDGTTLGYGYDNVGRLLRREVNGLAVRRFAYTSPTATSLGEVRDIDELGGSERVASIDGLGRTWVATAPQVTESSTYNSAGRLISTSDTAGLVTRYEYDDRDLVTRVTAPGGAVTAYERDGAGRVTTETDADGVTRTFNFTYSGLPYQTHQGPYLVAERNYNFLGQVWSANEGGVATRMTYDTVGRLATRREGTSNLTDELREQHYFYDDGDRLTRLETSPVAGAATAVRTIHYDSWGRPYEEIDPLGGVRKRWFDAGGRVRRVQDEEAAILETTYDELGRVESRQVPGRGWEHFTYAGKQTYEGVTNLWRTDRVDDEDLARGVTWSTYVDGSGFPIAEVRPDGSTRHTYTAGRLGSSVVRDLAGAAVRTTSYAYDGVTGRLDSVTAGPYVTSYDYTAAGRLQQTVTPDDTLARTYEYGLVKTSTEAGVTTTFTRDPTRSWITGEDDRVGSGATRSAVIVRDGLGRPSRITWNAGGPASIQTFADYDAFDHPWTTTHTWGVNGVLSVNVAEAYDAKGQILSRAVSGAGIPVKTARWSWYGNGALASVTTPTSRVLTYDYGPTFDYQIDRIRSISAPGQIPVDLVRVDARDARGAITQLTVPPLAQQRNYGHDDNGRTDHRTTGVGPAVDFAWDAAFNPDGTLDTETYNDAVGGAAWDNGYGYDAAGRLTQELAGKTGKTITYELDAAGNRTRMTVAQPSAPVPAVTDLAYDGPKLTQVGLASVTYDAWNAVSQDHHGNVFTRSADGDVTAITHGTDVVAIARDAAGIPVAALEPGPVARRTTWGLSPEGLPLEVEQGDDVLTYVSLEGIHVGTLENGAMTSVDANDRGTELRHAGDVLGEATAFGADTVPTGHDERFLFGMLERVPAASEIMLARRRTYDPTTGRFLEPDPIGSAGGTELYQYAHGDPVNFADPMGTTEVQTVCNPAPPISIPPYNIQPTTPQRLESGIEPSVFDVIEAGGGTPGGTRSGGHGRGSGWFQRPGQNAPLDFPIPPMCVANCPMVTGTEPSTSETEPADEPTTRPWAVRAWHRVEQAVGNMGREAWDAASHPRRTFNRFWAGGVWAEGGGGFLGKILGVETVEASLAKVHKGLRDWIVGAWQAGTVFGRSVLRRGETAVSAVERLPAAAYDVAATLAKSLWSHPGDTLAALAYGATIGGVSDFFTGLGQYISNLGQLPGAISAFGSSRSDEDADHLVDVLSGTFINEMKVFAPVAALITAGASMAASGAAKGVTVVSAEGYGTLEGAEALAARASALNSVRPWYKPFSRNTTAVIRGFDPRTGATQVYVAIEGKAKGAGRALRAALQGETFVRGAGDAEKTILDFFAKNGILPVEGGVSRNVCKGVCGKAIVESGGRLEGAVYRGAPSSTLVRTFFWGEGDWAWAPIPPTPPIP